MNKAREDLGRELEGKKERKRSYNVGQNEKKPFHLYWSTVGKNKLVPRHLSPVFNKTEHNTIQCIQHEKKDVVAIPKHKDMDIK